ncbi:MAG: rod shape-determining protein MreD [Longimicrobiales bacterium]
MKNREYLAFIIILIALDLSLHVGLGFGRGAPDLLTVAALLSARRLSGVKASLVGLVLGLLADSLALVSFGASAVALVIVSFLGARTRDMFEGNSTLFIAAYLFLGKWLRDAIWFGAAPAAHAGDPINLLWTVTPLYALITAVCGAIAISIFRAVVGERRMR